MIPLLILFFVLTAICFVMLFCAKRKAVWVVGMIVSAALLLGTLIKLGLGVAKGEIQVMADKEVVSPDKTYRLKVPGRWVPLKQLPSDAELRLGDLMAEQYVVTLSENTEELGMTLKEADEASFEAMKQVGRFATNVPKDIVVNGLPAIERRFDAVIDKVEVSYLRTVVHSKHRFHYLNFWTLKARKATHMPVFVKCRDSFQSSEGPPVPEVPVAMVPAKDVEQRVFALLKEQLGLPATAIDPKTKLTDLSADDLDTVEIVMALEETFGIAIEDAEAEKFVAVGDVLNYVKIHAKVPADLPEIPAEFPTNALLYPTFSGGTGPEFGAGSAFLTKMPAGRTLLLTAHHLFGPSGGLKADIPWRKLAQAYPKAKGIFSQSDEVGAEGTVAILIPNARGMDENDGAYDLAAYAVAPGARAAVLPMAAANAKMGDVVFLNSLHTGWTPAKVTGSSDKVLSYKFYLAGTRLQATSGAPVVNKQGELVGINLGGREGKVTVGIANPIESIRDLLSKAKIPQE